MPPDAHAAHGAADEAGDRPRMHQRIDRLTFAWVAQPPQHHHERRDRGKPRSCRRRSEIDHLAVRIAGSARPGGLGSKTRAGTRAGAAHRCPSGSGAAQDG